MTTEHYDTCHSCGELVLEGALYCCHCTERHPLSAHPLKRVGASLSLLAQPFVYLTLFGIRQLWRHYDREPASHLLRHHS